ncbi:hypothetical protein [Cryptosporangium phraense]|uniref:Uncharacterized protein n=1 Tax=Cryptosporangium phraense TaxID=2593070 RepID=A0A545ALK5_9ACTN|nr:hypothetical protein [Cryptosporangium phraense]TQS42197.1 hypothetical protein FL583_24980 [Cryptosporangium phraense]
MTSDETQPPPAYADVENPNDPGAGAGIAEQAPAESGTLSSAADEREHGDQDVEAGPAREAPGSGSGDTGLPSGPTGLPPADSSVPTGGSGVSGRQPGEPDLTNPGGTGLTTADTE